LTTSLQVDGSVFAIYNVGLTDHVVSDSYVKVNDGEYHVIRFTRNGANATLQIDDLPQQVKIPTGKFCRTAAQL
jgi:neurexin